MTWLAIGLGACVLLWALAVAALAAAAAPTRGRSRASSPTASCCSGGCWPTERIPRRRKLALVALLGYLASPIDLVPDFIPVAGQLDDVLAVVLVLRFVLRSADDDLLAEHWPGPPQALALLRR